MSASWVINQKNLSFSTRGGFSIIDYKFVRAWSSTYQTFCDTEARQRRRWNDIMKSWDYTAELTLRATTTSQTVWEDARKLRLRPTWRLKPLCNASATKDTSIHQFPSAYLALGQPTHWKVSVSWGIKSTGLGLWGWCRPVGELCSILSLAPPKTIMILKGTQTGLSIFFLP